MQFLKWLHLQQKDGWKQLSKGDTSLFICCKDFVCIIIIEVSKNKRMRPD